ncbi:PadR family transcriptional regulator [Thermaerobacter sp. FW80]|uniref:PadR family transcriptional regulator n=1 Tax=Thermaerobacter sp. FW80 TaxID=2546351 RepID=UPI001FA9B6C6|nr:PadR family transcriptional regulator [Thermaerobacter sp. FW80]
MERAGFVQGYFEPSPQGPPRKYYRILPQGHQALHRWGRVATVRTGRGRGGDGPARRPRSQPGLRTRRFRPRSRHPPPWGSGPLTAPRPSPPGRPPEGTSS